MKERGFALVTVLLLLVVLSSLLGVYLTITHIELATVIASKDSATGQFAAEGALNIRADAIRAKFIGYNVPAGSSPGENDNLCGSGNKGSGDFACQSHSFSNRQVISYVIDHQDGGDPAQIKVPQGELFENLSAQEYRYSAKAKALGPDGKVEALHELRFKNRLVPLFQFAAFYGKDLEINPGANMTLSGPVHTNGDLYLGAESLLRIDGQITTAGKVIRGRKDKNECMKEMVQIRDPANWKHLVPNCASRTTVTKNEANTFNGQIEFGIAPLTLPETASIDAEPGKLYWDRADIRIGMRVDNNDNPVTLTHSGQNITSGIVVFNQDKSIDKDGSLKLFNCAGQVKRNPAGGDNNSRAVGSTKSFYDNREGKYRRLLDIDLQGLITCLDTHSFFGNGKSITDDSDGGLVFHFSFDGPKKNNSSSPYGVRIVNGREIKSNKSGSPSIRKGLTIVSDQAVYVTGNYNSVNKKPAAILADTLNVLSEAFWSSGSQFKDQYTTGNLTNRKATYTEQNFAILSGTDTTGGIEGSGGQGGFYNGGLENYPRFHEDWSGITFKYRGSLVSLDRARRSDGKWAYGSPRYTAPVRDWNFDTSFQNAANLPPLTPRFVMLKQELFVRDFEQ